MSSSGRSASSTTTGMDAESMLASTLLRIRSDSNTTSRRTSPIASVTSISPMMAPRLLVTDKKPSPPNGVANNVAAAPATSTATPSMVHNPLAPTGMFTGIGNNNHASFGGANQGLSLEQISALQVLAADRAATFAAVAASSSPSRRAAAVAVAPSSPHPLDLLRASQQHLPVLQSRAPSVRQQLAAEAAAALHAMPKNETSTATTSKEEPVVRKEQVEAALRSKPQRGRKREDLSEQERLELTRTRNREHARSTRIRKKARYQELLDCEQQLEEVSKRQEVAQKRRRAVLEFLTLRCSMLKSVLDSEDPRASSSTEDATVSPKTLKDLVEDPDQFCFELNEASGSSPSRASNSPPLSGGQRMTLFDQDLANRVVGILGKPVLSLLRYAVKGSGNQATNGEAEQESVAAGVALDLHHGGFVNVQILLVRPDTQEKILVKTGVMQLDFNPASEKLRSVVWTTTRDFLSDLSAAGALNAQVSHPSVVSLDPAASSTSWNQESTPPTATSSISANSSGCGGTESMTTTKPSRGNINSNHEEAGGDGGPGMNI